MHYVCSKVWEEVPWTDNFVDISTTTLPKFTTKAKIRFDDNFLYVAAQLQEPQVWATLTEHDSVVYQDNDFEVGIVSLSLFVCGLTMAFLFDSHQD